jgi:hypothetical protein
VAIPSVLVNGHLFLGTPADTVARYRVQEGSTQSAWLKVVPKMQPLYKDPHFTFRFAEHRVIPRFHLEGVPAGQRILVFRCDPSTGERRDLLTMTTVGEGGWVNLRVPLMVRAGEAFIVLPEPGPLDSSPLRIVLTALGVAGLLATAGFLVSLVQGGSNLLVLVVCCGALGAFVVLLGYGPIALLIGALGHAAEWLHRKSKASSRE